MEITSIPSAVVSGTMIIDKPLVEEVSPVLAVGEKPVDCADQLYSADPRLAFPRLAEDDPAAALLIGKEAAQTVARRANTLQMSVNAEAARRSDSTSDIDPVNTTRLFDEVRSFSPAHPILASLHAVQSKGSAEETGDILVDQIAVDKADMDAFGAIVTNYLNFHNDLNQLLVELQGLAGKGVDGDKLLIDGEAIVKAIHAFMQARVGMSIGGPYYTKAAADEIMKAFKGDTLKISEGTDAWGRRVYFIKPTYSGIDKIIDTLTEDATSRKDLKEWFDWWPDNVGNWERFSENAAGKKALENLNKSVYTPGLQQYNSALDNIRKTHSTDMDLGLGFYNRKVSMFDSYLKIVASFFQTLAQTNKLFTL